MHRLKQAAALMLILPLILLLSSCLGIEKDKEQPSMEFMLDKESDSYTLFYYTDTTTRTELIIPDTFKGKKVTGIRKLAINSCDTLERIVIGEYLTNIEPWAITKNQHLKEIVVDPNNPVYCDIDGILFNKDRTKLLSYPNANTAKLSSEGGVESTIRYEVPEGTQIIGHCAFYHCYTINELVLPDSVLEIEERAFHKMTALSRFDAGKNLEIIGTDAFLGCEGLKEIEFPSTLKKIGDYALYNARNLEIIRINARSDEVEQGYKWRPSSAGGSLNHAWSIEWADKTENY